MDRFLLLLFRSLQDERRRSLSLTESSSPKKVGGAHPMSNTKHGQRPFSDGKYNFFFLKRKKKQENFF
jgi:hypothetical protein